MSSDAPAPAAAAPAPVKLAINGFGRIGRLCLRRALADPRVAVVAVNDPMLSDAHAAYLLAHDSVHGRLRETVAAEPGALVIGGGGGQLRIPLYHEREGAPPWGGADVCVLECSGMLTSAAAAAAHLAHCGRVIISAPAKDDSTPTFVVGVNDGQFDAAQRVVSNASCTTNALAPIAAVLHARFGIAEGLCTTVHAATATQLVVDGATRGAGAAKDMRAGRAVLDNIIPASTGAARAVGLVLPALAGRLSGNALRVPVRDVSVLDLTCRLETPASYAEVIAALREAAAEGPLRGILGVTDEQVVSSDFVGDARSAIVDVGAGLAIGDRLVKVVAFYDNETAYAARMLDLAVVIMRDVKAAATTTAALPRAHVAAEGAASADVAGFFKEQAGTRATESGAPGGTPRR
jgi:glyceraldehyde 3-phosphate dehydrogenase